MKKLFNRILRLWLAWKIEWEIYHKIFPHLNGWKDWGYEFSNDAELERIADTVSPEEAVAALEMITRHMPEAHGRAFRLIARREITKLILAYAKIGRERVYIPAENEAQPALHV